MLTTKKCSKCNTIKDLSEFIKPKKRRLHRAECKQCGRELCKAYSHTERGLIRNIYSNQKQSSKRRGHIMPQYTKEELTEWLYLQPNFIPLFKSWVKSGFTRELVPSVDRHDDYLPYSFDNITLTVWKSNKKKQTEDILLARSTSGERCKAVIQYDKYMNIIDTHHSIAHAQRVTKEASIWHYITNRRISPLGFRWEYKE